MTTVNPRGLYRVAHKALTPVSSAYRSYTFRRGTDATTALTTNSCLVLAPHPDDETLGCAATIMRKRSAGTPVTIAIATDGEVPTAQSTVESSEWASLRRGEALCAAATMGVDAPDVVFLGFKDLVLQDEIELLDERLLTLIKAVEPDEIFVPARGDRHPDHYALNLAVRNILKRNDFRGSVYEYPIWFWRVYPWTSRPTNIANAMWYFFRDPVAALFQSAPLLVSTGGYVDRKRTAIACYESQASSTAEEQGLWTFPDGFANSFLGPHEIFFPIEIG